MIRDECSLLGAEMRQFGQQSDRTVSKVPKSVFTYLNYTVSKVKQFLQI